MEVTSSHATIAVTPMVKRLLPRSPTAEETINRAVTSSRRFRLLVMMKIARELISVAEMANNVIRIFTMTIAIDAVFLFSLLNMYFDNPIEFPASQCCSNYSNCMIPYL